MIDKKSYMAGFWAAQKTGRWKYGKYRLGDILKSSQIILEIDSVTGLSYYKIIS